MVRHRGFEHLIFRSIREDKPYVPSKKIAPNEITAEHKRNYQAHGRNLKKASAELSLFWHQRRHERILQNSPEIHCGIPFLLSIDPGVDIGFLRGLGLEVVCELEDGFILVASEDVDLIRLNQKLDCFIRGEKKSGSPSQIYGMEEEQVRISRVLSASLQEDWDGIVQKPAVSVCIAIECRGLLRDPDFPEKREQETSEAYQQRCNSVKQEFQQKVDQVMQQRQIEFEHLVGFYGAEIHSYVEQYDCFEAAVVISGRGLRDLVENYPYIFEVKKSTKLMMEKSASLFGESHGGLRILPPEAGSPVICIIDSGIQEKHRYLSPAILENDSVNLVSGEDSVQDLYGNGGRTGGHGTRVAGAVLYPGNIPDEGQVVLPFFLRNARILDRNNMLAGKDRPEVMLQKIVEIFAGENAGVKTKIFNHSVCENTPFDHEDFVHMSSWAAMLDSLSYDYDILFIQAAGNISKDIISALMTVLNKPYPEYFLENPARIANPAESLQAIAVGSLSLADFQDQDMYSLGGRGDISSFSRIGPGIWDSLKPDVVEYGGTHIFNSYNHQLSVKPEVCPDLIRTSPEGPSHARDDIGTSFSTPRVTSIAGEIQRVLPEAPALLYRALIAQSARYPKEQYFDRPENMDWSRLVREMGYGIPDVKRATENNEYRVTFITSEITEIADKEAHVYSIVIPEELRNVGDNYQFLIEVTLSYAAKPRRTRRKIKRYMSTWVEWKASRIRESEESFLHRIFEERSTSTEREESFHWKIHERQSWGRIKDFSRSNQTLQKDWCLLKSHQLGDHFCIAVIGHKGWGSLFKAKYALAVTIEAIQQEVAVYESVRLANQVRIETPEVPIEIQI